MRTRVNILTILRSGGPWILFIAAPLLVNGIAWRGFVVPQRTQLLAWHDANSLIALKPKLKELLAQSRQIRMEWAGTAFSKKDYAGVMQSIQQSAGRYGVQVTETRTKGAAIQQETAGQSAIPLELEVTGSFSKLARWMSDVEGQEGFQIDSWTLKKTSDQVPQVQLSVKMTVYLGGA